MSEIACISRPAFAVGGSIGWPAEPLLRVNCLTVLDVIPFLTGIPVPGMLVKLAGICLVFLPLTFSWAIVRYRLMDVDLIFKRGVTYTLATAALVGVYFGAVAVAAELVHARSAPARARGA